MEKSILVFTNGEKLGDGIIKLPLLHELKKRLPNYLLIWMTNKGKTVYNSFLQSIAAQYIDEIIEQAELNPFFWQDISNSYNFQKGKFFPGYNLCFRCDFWHKNNNEKRKIRRIILDFIW